MLKLIQHTYFMKKTILILLFFLFQVVTFAHLLQHVEDQTVDDKTNNTQTIEGKTQQANAKGGILSYVRNAMQFNRSIPQEKVYLHFDNTGYFQNETIWFKAYVTTLTTAGQQSAGSLSKVLYVELLNPSGDVIKTTKWHIDDKGMANGDMKLDSLYGSGFYEVRAYTRYMTNWGVNACFSRVFPVFQAVNEDGQYKDLTIKTRMYKERDPNNRSDADSLYTKAIEEGIYTNDLMKTVSVQFYPEGGDMICGKKCRIAMLAVDDNGRPYHGEGFVTNETGDVLAKVQTDTLGRGLFTLIPDGSALKFQLKNLNGKVQIHDMPQTKAEGVTLMLDAVNDDMLVSLQCSDGICGHVIGFVAMNNGCITYCDTVKAGPLVEVELNRSTMSEGVNQFTVFDEDGRILADRLFFICPQSQPSEKILFSTKTKRLKPCGQVELDVKTQPNSVFSFSAIDAQAMNNGKQGNMKTWMLLGSEVKGYINNVNYYFESDDEQHRRDADLLMLTQGWRRYDWEMMAGHKHFEKIQYLEDKFYIHGKLNAYRKWNKVNNVNMEIYLYNKRGESLLGNTVTDSVGNYSFELPFVDDEWNVQINTMVEDKNKTYYVGIDRNFSPVPRYISPLEASISSPLKPNIFLKDEVKDIEEEVFVPITERDHVLQNVEVKAKRRYFTNDDFKYKNERFGQQNATLFYDMDRELDKLLDSGKPEITLCEWLATKNSLFKFDRKNANDPPRYADDRVAFHLDNDERNVANELYNLNYGVPERPYFDTWMRNVKKIYIAPHSRSTIDNFDILPCCHIYLYMHVAVSTSKKKGIRHSHFQGFNKPSVFKMEDYSILPPMADFRRTIYWNPNVETDSEGRAKIEFFNNSTCDEMFISAEGLSGEGKCLEF